MRADMGRLIIEDGRRGNGGPKTVYDSIRRRGEEWENVPSRESMSRHRKKDGNSLGDRLEPLKRYLVSNVGRRWADVYSEICAVNDRRTIRGYHLLTHLRQYVLIGRMRTLLSYQDFFVGPDGILKKVPPTTSWRTRARLEKKKDPVERIKLSEGWEYKKIEGIWYKLHIRADEIRIPGRFNVRTYHVGSKHEWTYTSWIEAKTITEFVQDKKLQCGKKELKKIKEMIDAGR